NGIDEPLGAKNRVGGYPGNRCIKLDPRFSTLPPSADARRGCTARRRRSGAVRLFASRRAARQGLSAAIPPEAPPGNAMPYIPSSTRYDSMLYNRCGRSGLKLPAISLGLWHNFGFDRSPDSMRAICRVAFDLGITHFDLANNYGPPPGSAEINFGEI